MGFSEPQFLGVVLALVVCLSDGQRTERGITQLTVVVLCGQDDPGCPFIQSLWTQDETELEKLQIDRGGQKKTPFMCTVQSFNGDQQMI